MRRRARVGMLAAAVGVTMLLGAGPLDVAAHAAPPGPPRPSFSFRPGDLLISRSVYDENTNISVGETLPPGCAPTAANGGCATAVAGGTYPQVFNNAEVDGSFGVTSPIFLDELTPSGRLVGSLEVPNSTMPGISPGHDQMVTSFSSKSELALNLSPGGRDVSFVGYLAPSGTPDVSNADTPLVNDPSNPIPGRYYRVVAQVDRHGHFTFTLTNAYTGDNGRAAIGAGNVVYAAGNASGDLTNPSVAPDVILGAGAQLIHPDRRPEVVQSPGVPTPVGSFNITELPGVTKPDKIGKDTNFRGITIYHNVLYYTKGSGGLGVNSVYFVDTANTGCEAGGGVGLPQAGAALPKATYGAPDLTSTGLQPYNMCILKGFPDVVNKQAPKSSRMYPFGLWFASPTTLYVADEGSGSNTYSAAANLYTGAAAQTTAGLQKWVLRGGSWHLAYTLTRGLKLGQPYTVPGYPTGTNGETGLPWSPATDGLRALTGRVNRDGTVSIYAVTSTVSGGGDQGADPNRLVAITDTLGATTPPAAERFTTLRTARFGEVLRGVSWTPGTRLPPFPVRRGPVAAGGSGPFPSVPGLPSGFSGPGRR